MPHIKYEDWTGGKKFKGGRWGHLFFPEPEWERPLVSYMFEVLYKSPADPRREASISESVDQFGGNLTCREEPDAIGAGPVCLTYEFDDPRVAERAASYLRSRGEHVEAPADYGE